MGQIHSKNIKSQKLNGTNPNRFFSYCYEQQNAEMGQNQFHDDSQLFYPNIAGYPKRAAAAENNSAAAACLKCF